MARWIPLERMDFDRLKPVLEILSRGLEELDDRARSYLLLYPSLLKLAKMSGTHKERYLWVANAAYGWMPRVVRVMGVERAAGVRVEGEKLARAVRAFKAAQHAKDLDTLEATIEPIASNVCSAVGASKILHLANPRVFPIWDSRVQRFWDGGVAPNQNRMKSYRRYCEYARDVHSLTRQQQFKAFYMQYQAAHKARAEQAGLRPYTVTAVRAVEAAAFELAGYSVYDDEAGG